MPQIVLTAFLALLALVQPLNAQALRVEPVTSGVYAIVGSLSQRDAENLGNNATFGLVVTDEGAVLIDAGGTYQGAQALHEAVRGITDQPVVMVINSGGQDHRWLGNGYWHEQGAQIVASAAAVTDQQDRVSMQLTGLATLVGAEGLAGTEPYYADIQFPDTHEFSIGGVDFALTHAPAHTLGESFVWLDDSSVMFAGDMVYVERMLGVGPMSSSLDWVSSFETMAAHAPTHIVPGHGAPTDLATATRDTYDYLTSLRAAIGALIEEGGDIIDAPKVDQSDFSYLQNFDMLAGRNAQEVFSQMEWE